MDAAHRPFLAPGPFTPRPTIRPFRAVAGQPSVDVSDRELDRAVTRVAEQFEAQQDTLRLNAWVIGALPVLYGIMTWVFGQRLWSGSSAYMHALSVHGAPQTWGTVFLVLGVISIAAHETKRYTTDAVSCALLAIVLAMFMASFITAGFVLGDNVSTASPALSYAIFSVLFLGRARLAWKSRAR